MTISKSLYNNDTQPYFDDFDESKNYHRILFKPGYSVQARELTQLQTALQAQIDKYGQWAFNNGSAVIGGKTSLDVEYDFIKIEDVFYSTVLTGSGASYNSSTNIADFVGKTITGTKNTTNQVKAKVIGFSTFVSNGEPNTLFIKYTNNGGPNKDVKKFVAGETFVSSGTAQYGKVGGEASASATEYVGTTASTNSSITGDKIGKGSSAYLEEGVFFLHGTFVYVPGQTLILEKYSNTPTYALGLSVVENEVTSGTDASLTDNASGSPNHTAPGADRYQIVATLVKDNILEASQTTVNFIPLTKIKNGITQSVTTDDTNVALTERFATRTFDESGNYVVRPFVLDINEHLNDGAGNNGFKLVGDGGDSSKMAITVEPSVAYVQGFRIDKGATDPVIIDKPRAASDTGLASGATTAIPLGNFIKLRPADIVGIPDVHNLKLINLTATAAGAGTVLGTARTRGLEKITVGDPHYRLYIFDIVMNANQVFTNVKGVIQANTGVDFKGTVGTTVAASTSATLFDTGNNTLVYRLPFDTVKTLETSGSTVGSYKVRQKVTTTINGSGKAIFTIQNGLLANNDDIFVSIADNVSGKAIAIDTVESGINTSQFVLGTADTGVAMNTGVAIQAIVTVLRNNFQPKTKSLAVNQTVTKTFSPGTALYPLGVNDVSKLVDIKDVNNKSVLNKFILDDGQRENFYTQSSIILKGGETVPAGAMVITYDHYTHGPGDYFSVDSYYTPGAANGTPTASEAAKYERIPSFKSSQGVIDLRDCLDFRPVKAIDGTFSGGISAISSPLAPDNFATNNISVYLPRKDKLFITKQGQYKYVAGVSNIDPVAPENVKDAMPLYTLEISPYVFNKLDIKPIPYDNKRYTMRDIGKLDKRIKTLEYYTTLSLLEKSAQSTPLLDGDGNPRIKNGFIVDNFTGHNIGNVSNPDYHVAVDKSAGLARPMFDERNVNLIRKTSDSGTCVNSSVEFGVKGDGVARRGDIVTLPYTSGLYIDQPFSTYAEFVNPYDIFVWEGKIELSPGSDEWKEVDVRPDIIIDDNSIYDQFVAMAEEEGILGTVWNEWETNWAGKEQTGETSTQRLVGKNVAQSLGLGQAPRNTNSAIIKETQKAFTETGTASRSGLTTSIATDTQFKEVGDYVVETNFIPFMRSRRIFFQAELMKPNSKLHAFFNGTNVTAYCKTESSFVQFSTRTGVKSYSGKAVWVDSNGATSSDSGSLTTDAAGRCTGSFVIPRNDVLKFKTGSREFKLTDSSANDSNLADTFASTTFYSQGLLEVHQKTVIATKIPRLVTREVGESNSVTRTTFDKSVELVRWTDPVSQTFVITDPDSSGAGVFLNSVDVFFNSKDSNIPIEVSIRSVENGYPTQRVVPGSDVVVYPADITTSANASSGTNVKFKFPVYLERDTEYAIVLIANSADYKVYVAEVGGMDLTRTSIRVNKQPYNGVFFTSANASTWTAEQTKDLKFKLNRCVFSTSDQHITLVNDSVEPFKLNPNSLEFLTATKIRVHHKNHGHYGSVAHQVVLAGFVAENGITNISKINKAHAITEIEHDSYVITHTGSATATGIVGGGTEMTATENRSYNTLRLSLENTQVPGTTLITKLLPTAGSSMDSSTQSPYGVQPEVTILPNSNFRPDIPLCVMSPVANGGSTTLTEVKCILGNGGNDRISPVLDIERTSLVTVQNRINDATSNATAYSSRGTYIAETASTGTSNLAKYITKKIELENEADIIDVYTSIHRPTDSSVDLYFKVQGSGDDGNFNEIAWTLVNPVKAIPISDSGMSEAHYEINPTTGGASLAFSKFAIKIVLRSKNSSNVPMIGDFRAIATTA
jgi:hypothetical protein